MPRRDFTTLNLALTSRLGPVGVCSIAFIFALVVYAGPPLVRGWSGSFPGRDWVAYLNIAVQVYRGHGLMEDEADPLLGQFETTVAGPKAVASAPPPGAPPDHVASEPHPSTRWPPLFPLLLGYLFRVIGPSVNVARCVNCVLMASTCAIGTLIACRRVGALPALVFPVVFAAIDIRTRDYARSLMTEPLASVAVSILCWQLLRFIECPSARAAALIGSTLGVAVLARSMFVLWLPSVLLAMTVASWTKSGHLRGFSKAGIALSTCLLVTAPWFAHNCLELKAFMPLGSHVYTLPSGYSDEALQRHGEWFSLGDGYFAGVYDPLDTPTEKARKMAEYGSRQALNWAQAHPLKVLLLFMYKVENLWLPRPTVELLFYLIPFLGFLVLRPHRDNVVLCGILLLNTLVVGATWTWDEDRFQVPVLAVLHVYSVIGLWSLALLVARDRNSARAELLRTGSQTGEERQLSSSRRDGRC